MQVSIYAVNQNSGDETFERNTDLAEFCEQSGDEPHDAIGEFQRMGRVWIGGGASQLFVARRIIT